MDVYETKTYRDCKIEIFREECPDSPLEWVKPEERQVYFVLKMHSHNLPCEVDNIDLDEYSNWHEAAASIRKANPELKGMKYKFVNWYEHGGVIVSLQDSDTPSDIWDSGIAGIVYGKTDKTIESYFKEWKMWLEGDVYYYTITDPNGNDIDSLGEVYDEYPFTYIMSEAKRAIDNYLNKPLPHKVAAMASAIHGGNV